MEIQLKSGERIDDLQNNGLRIIQNSEKFCFGMDAVLLTGFAKAKAGDKLLDLGTGTGIIPLLLSAKTKAEKLVGLELQPESCDMADRSVRLNDLEGRVEIVNGDIKMVQTIFTPASFDVVTTNPPYMPVDQGEVNPADAKAIARHEVACSLKDVINAAVKMLKPNGHFYMVHRPFRMAEIIEEMSEAGLEPKRIRLVYPYVDKEPQMLLIEGVKGGKKGVVVMPPLVLYDAPGKYSKEIIDNYGF